MAREWHRMLLFIWYGLVLVTIAELLIAWGYWPLAIPLVLVQAIIAVLVAVASIAPSLFADASESTDDDGPGR
jgi:hypothetical protein